jgi:hypothetical protein
VLGLVGAVGSLLIMISVNGDTGIGAVICRLKLVPVDMLLATGR